MKATRLHNPCTGQHLHMNTANFLFDYLLKCRLTSVTRAGRRTPSRQTTMGSMAFHFDLIHGRNNGLSSVSYRGGLDLCQGALASTETSARCNLWPHSARGICQRYVTAPNCGKKEKRKEQKHGDLGNNPLAVNVRAASGQGDTCCGCGCAAVFARRSGDHSCVCQRDHTCPSACAIV